ncbi:hypothetical protein V499_00010 [Pseudogymnoascus sp. VKM F-103]|nr:hypothetical protein V499_00010 [Pseudogymnoascus sp. VKM F-103]
MVIDTQMPVPPPVTIENGFLEKIQRGEIATTCLIKLLRTVEAPGLLKTAGFDSILIDMEHSTLTLDTTSQICIAALYAGITPIVRSPTKEPFFVSRILDGGALGVIVPHIRTVQDAQDVVNAAKFAPVGQRSLTAGLPHLQFRPLPAKTVSPAVNAATMVIPMIETLEALEIVDEIAALEGVDSLLIGTNDLTAEFGIPGQYDSPRVHDAYVKTIAACKKHGKSLGIGGIHTRPDLLEKFCLMGANWILAGIDSGLLLGAATNTVSQMDMIADAVKTSGGHVKLKTHVTCRNGKGEAVMVRRGLGAVRPKSFLEILEGRLSELGAMAKEHGIPIEAEQGDPPTSVAVTVSQRNDHISETEIYASSNLEPSWPEAPDGTGSAQATNTQQEDPTGWRRSGPDIGLLSLSAMAEPKSRASEFLKGISMPGIISAITQSYGGNPEATTRIDALWDEIGKDIRQSVGKTPQRLHLPKEDALTYVSRYYDVVDYRYPHLPRQEVMRGISAITAPEEGDYERTLASDPAKVFMAYMVLAITPLVSDTYPVAQASFISIHILSKALKILDKVFQLEDGVDIIHCLTLLVVFSLHSSAAGSTWHLAGVTMKKCIALGFHREVIASQNELPIEEMEQRRWAFWSLISSALDRPYGISDKDINIELPGSRAPFSSALTSIQRRQIHLYRYAILQSKIYKDRYLKPFSYHLSYLLHWKTSAPTYPDLYPIHQEEHLTSLYNTLCLRALTYSVLYPSLRGLDGAQDTDSWRLGMSQRSQAVIRSLNRAGMKRRSTLSWITAYSASTSYSQRSVWATSQPH